MFKIVARKITTSKSFACLLQEYEVILEQCHYLIILSFQSGPANDYRNMQQKYNFLIYFTALSIMYWGQDFVKLLFVLTRLLKCQII